MRIDPDANICDLLDRWKAGNHEYVLDALESDHPGLTAMFLITGVHDRHLTIADCNTITNLLMDRRKAKVDEAG